MALTPPDGRPVRLNGELHGRTAPAVIRISASSTQIRRESATELERSLGE